MSHQRTLLSHGVMKAKGAYNKYAKIPAAGAALATPFLNKAVRKITSTSRSASCHCRLRLVAGQEVACPDADRNSKPAGAPRSRSPDSRFSHRPAMKLLQLIV